MTNWSIIKNLFKPLDLIFFQGSDIVSKFICTLEKERLGRGDYSHVGIIVTRDLMPSVTQLEPDKLYVWESTMSKELFGLTDGITDVYGKGYFGVQIRDLKEVVEVYADENSGTKIAWGKLINNPWHRKPTESLIEFDTRKKIVVKVMKKALIKYEGKKYDANCLNLLGALFPTCRKMRDNLEDFLDNGHHVLRNFDIVSEDSSPKDWLFCSELAANVYRDLKVFNSKFDPRNVVPVDFLGCDEDGLPKLCRDPVQIFNYKDY